MKLQQLIYLQEVIKYQSFSVASEKNFISQPTISAAINALEKELGASLLRRHNKGVIPTELGLYIAHKTEDINQILLDINRYSQKTHMKNLVNISMIPGICYILLPATIQYLETSPIALSVQTCDSEEVLHNVSTGSSVFGILIYQDDIESLSIRYTPLFQDQYCLYVGPKSPLWGRKAVTLEEALSQPYIAHKNQFLKNTKGILEKTKGLTPNIILRTDEVESMKQIISQYPYVSFFSEVMYKNDLYIENNLIQKISISDYDMSIQIGYIESTRYNPTNEDYYFVEAFKRALSNFE